MKSAPSSKTDPDEGKRHLNLWVIQILFLTIMISAVIATLANVLLDNASVLFALLILFMIILLGVVFDIIGVAVTAADPKPFHSMASHKVKGAREAIMLINHADRVSSICNDVVGDVCGVISGTACAALIVLIFHNTGDENTLDVAEIVLTALVSGMTVGGKAAGKTLAVNKPTEIVHMAARSLCFFCGIGNFFRKKSK